MENLSAEILESEREIDFDTQMKDIEKLIKELGELRKKQTPSGVPTPEQIRKFMTLVFFFQVYAIFIDPDFILVNSIEKFLIELNDEIEKANIEDLDLSDEIESVD